MGRKSQVDKEYNRSNYTKLGSSGRRRKFCVKWQWQNISHFSLFYLTQLRLLSVEGIMLLQAFVIFAAMRILLTLVTILCFAKGGDPMPIGCEWYKP